MTRLTMPTLFFLLLGTASVQASPTALLPGQFTQLAFEQHPGAQLPRDVRLRDDAGHAVTTASLFDGGRPLVLVFDYYRCTTLCGVVLGDLAAALAQTPLAPGKDYAVMAVSIDPGDSPADAAALKARHFERDPTLAGAIHALVGDPSDRGREVRRLASAAGFRYQLDEATGQYAHPASVVLVSPGGTVSRYILGVGYDPTDLRLGLVDASRGAVGSVADHLLLLCYGYDAKQGRYNAEVGRLIQATGVLSVLALGLLVWRTARRPRKG
ncbi:protein SCO1/2 [Azospirillum lipoferum]|uniref:SCO family protein n=1 Tax=Azospirillum lipoferum TaxID=193 RepID=A0A5A9G6A7_AZOLI|nr:MULTISPECIES: SCO family protein [Azospirillum]KAA0589132.1 SCO family protein [Azospirillum lipoferum]MCP1613421.1 protein SCO1/2 [Azospirillum lipoferum]MDW5533143.1 SCO family protein [Azospirillum sp. NL1]